MEQKKKVQDRVKTVKIVDENGTELNREDIDFNEVDFKADGKGTVTVIDKEDEDIVYYEDGLH